MSSEINLLIDEIEAIAKQTRGYIAGHAAKSGTSFANSTLDAGAFAGIPAGMSFHGQQDAAHQVFVETINGVVADLEQFGETLAANAASHRAVDESNADTMNAHEIAQAQQADQQAASQAMDDVNQQYQGADTGDGLESEQAYDETREGNEALDVETEQDSGAEGPDGGSEPTEPQQDSGSQSEDTAAGTSHGGMRG